MTTLRQIDLSCPICSNKFSSQAVLSTSYDGGKRTDFHERAVGAQPLPFFLHMCSRCGYTGLERDFGEEAEIGPVIKEHVWDELAPKLPGGTVSGSDKYEFAAKVATWQGCEPLRIADLLLRAAWCCVDEGDVEAERYFRQQAARAFEQALATYDGVDRDDRAVLTYLVGELWRRVGNLKMASDWFEQVGTEITNSRAQHWVVEAARQQRDHPREWFG